MVLILKIFKFNKKAVISQMDILKCILLNKFLFFYLNFNEMNFVSWDPIDKKSIGWLRW